MRVARSLAFAAWMYGLMALLGLISWPFAVVSRRGARQGMRLWARLTMWGLRWIGGVRVEIRGRAFAPTGPALVASKHFAMLDTIAPFIAMPDPAIVFKRELLRLPVYSYYALRGEHIPVDRDGQASALKSMLAAARRLTEAGRQVLIFPEGTRVRPGDPPDYKPGVAALYKGLGLPCTPVALNTARAWPIKGMLLTPGRVVIEFLPPIPPGLARGAFMARLEAEIEAATAALFKEAPAPARPADIREATPA